MTNEFYAEVEKHLQDTLLPESKKLKSFYELITSNDFKAFLNRYIEEYPKDLCDKLVDVTPLSKEEENEIYKKLNGIKYFKIFIDDLLQDRLVNEANIKIAEKTLNNVSDTRSM